ncbi:MAG: helix-turn-helix domain-containing protein [Christensenellaceae bacterium]|jgi:transcriptional regulator with XRE-family HTH domain|nr:helix-turn-helix domain-containing protein [Christensenellaceae bacterium]
MAKPNILSRAFAARLRKIMTTRNLNQAQLSEIIGIRQSQVSNLLGGISEPSYRTLNQLKEKFGLSAEELL